MLVDYIKSYNNIKIICPVHGIFEQTPRRHLNGGCLKCGIDIRTKTTDIFIKESIIIHGDRYDYSLVEYITAHIKVKIICLVHGVFEQTPKLHLRSSGCPMCLGIFIERYNINNIPIYQTYVQQLELYEDIRRSSYDKNILEIRCTYCNKWYIPKLSHVQTRLKAIYGKIKGESRFYCSDGCKSNCDLYAQSKYPKGHKINKHSREVQPQLRKLVLERDNWTCQKCSSDKDLHCHHYEGIEINPVESADIDNCITLCKKCHNAVHKQDDCNMRRNKCK
jgi:5-methylcytosine-specific restriction endonuclease McrA